MRGRENGCGKVKGEEGGGGGLPISIEVGWLVGSLWLLRYWHWIVGGEMLVVGREREGGRKM